MPYLRFFHVVKPSAPVESVDFAVVVEDAVGRAYFTDLAFQDGSMLSGWMPNTREFFLRQRDTNGSITSVRHYSALTRGPVTLVLPNRGEVTSALDVTVTADGGQMPRLSLAHEFGAHRTTAPAPAMQAILQATTRTAALDGRPVFGWGGRYLFAPAVDAKFDLDPDYRDDLPDPPATQPARPHMRVFATLKEWQPGPERF